VEQIRQNRRSDGESNTPSLHRTSYLLVVPIIWLGLTVVSLGAIAWARYGVPSPNPFSSYVDIFPGQPSSALQARGFSCSMEFNRYTSNEYCFSYPAAGVFSKVGVVVSKGVISIISFTMRENTLRLGDLMMLWGKPDFTENDRSTYYFWRGSGVTAIADNDTGRFTHYFPVRRAIIANP
jgi:hypothetical protein